MNTLRAPGTIVRWVTLAVLAAAILFPVYTTFVTAFLPQSEVNRGVIFPSWDVLTFDNFATAFRAIPLGRQYLVSLAVVVLQAGAQLVTASLAAYALVFPSWRLRSVAFAAVVATLAIPGDSLVIPNYELVSAMGLRDSILGIAIPYLAAGYPIFLLRQAFISMPRETWEASRIDGCGDLRSLVHIVLPSCSAQVTTAALWSALAAWNGFFWPLLITDSAVNRTVQVGLSQLVTSEITTPSVIYAGTATVLIPTTILVVVGQRFLLRGLSRGVMK